MNAAYTPLRGSPFVASGTLSTTNTVIADLTNKPTGFGAVRRVRLLNKDAAIYIGLAVAPTAALANAKTFAERIQVAPGTALEVLVDGMCSMAMLAESGTPAYNLTISDA